MDNDMRVLQPLTSEDAKRVLAEFEAFNDERGLALNAIPVIVDGKIEVQVRFFKLVDLVPKDGGFQVSGGNDGKNEGTEGTAEGTKAD